MWEEWPEMKLNSGVGCSEALSSLYFAQFVWPGAVAGLRLVVGAELGGVRRN